MTLVGELSLWVALLMAIWAATVSFAGGALARNDLVASGERAIHAVLAMVALASLGLWAAIISHDFSIELVASFTSANLPKAYLLAALWAGPAGSLLFWCLILAIFAALAVHATRTRNRVLMPYVAGTLGIALALLLVTLCFGVNPYERLDWIPPDGRGMNPRLQNPGMLLHPPSLYLGYAAMTIPFAFAIAALITRRLDAEWLAAVRRWSLVAWFFNAAGILAGMWWAYVEPGRAGYWALEPVESASLLPWLVNTALLYSIMVQEKRAMLRKWNVTLLVAAFLLAILGTLITVSEITSGTYSFAQSPVGYGFGALLLVAMAVLAYMVTRRLDDVELGSDVPIASVAGRNLRRFGGYTLYLGAAAMLAAFAGQAFRKEYNLTFKSGDAHEVTDAWGNRWRFISQGVSTYNALNREVAAIALDVSRNGKPAGVMTSEKRQHVDSRGEPTFVPSTEAGIRSSPGQDVYIVLGNARDDAGVGLRVAFNPLVSWVWVGGALMTIGGLIVLSPQRSVTGARNSAANAGIDS